LDPDPGLSFLRIRDGWWIRLAANKTKSGGPDLRPAAAFLTSCFDEYLHAYRPGFLCAGRVGRARDRAALQGAGPEMATGPLWMAQRGQAMSIVTMKKTITQTTRRTLGVSVSPHFLPRVCGGCERRVNGNWWHGLLLSDPRGRFVSMPRDEPSFIVAPGECDELGAQVLDGFERSHPEHSWNHDRDAA
jgi:hypothetical protein